MKDRAQKISMALNVSLLLATTAMSVVYFTRPGRSIEAGRAWSSWKSFITTEDSISGIGLTQLSSHLLEGKDAWATHPWPLHPPGLTLALPSREDTTADQSLLVELRSPTPVRVDVYMGEQCLESLGVTAHPRRYRITLPPREVWTPIALRLPPESLTRAWNAIPSEFDLNRSSTDAFVQADQHRATIRAFSHRWSHEGAGVLIVPLTTRPEEGDKASLGRSFAAPDIQEAVTWLNSRLAPGDSALIAEVPSDSGGFSAPGFGLRPLPTDGVARAALLTRGLPEGYAMESSGERAALSFGKGALLNRPAVWISHIEVEVTER